MIFKTTKSVPHHIIYDILLQYRGDPMYYSQKSKQNCPFLPPPLALCISSSHSSKQLAEYPCISLHIPPASPLNLGGWVRVFSIHFRPPSWSCSWSCSTGGAWASSTPPFPSWCSFSSPRISGKISSPCNSCPFACFSVAESSFVDSSCSCIDFRYAASSCPAYNKAY